jgi:hypothetical protein
MAKLLFAVKYVYLEFLLHSNPKVNLHVVVQIPSANNPMFLVSVQVLSRFRFDVSHYLFHVFKF